MRAAVVLALAACSSSPASDPVVVESRPADLLARIPAGADGILGLDPSQAKIELTVPGIVSTQASGGSYAAIRISSALRRELPAELGELQWVALSLSPARVLRGTAMFPTAEAAAKVAVDLGMLRKLALTHVPAPIAAALDKVAVTAWGPSLTISATWTAADLTALGK